MQNVTSPSTSYTDTEWGDAVTRLSKILGLQLPKPSDVMNAKVRVAASDEPIKFASAGVDLSKASQGGLPFWAVEPLIQQAATLLDRSLATDQQHFDLSVQQFNARQEVCQFFALDTIHQKEIEAHLYELAGLEARSDLGVVENQRKSKADLDALYAALMLAMSKDTALQLEKIAYTLAVNNADCTNGPSWEPSRQPGESTVDGPGAARRTYIGNAAMYQVGNTFPAQQAQHGIEERQYRLQMANADARIHSAQTKSDYYNKDRDFKLLRRQIALAFMQAKYMAISKGGALDYGTRLSDLEARQQLDVSQAFERMLAINIGLKSIYGATIEGFPSSQEFSLQSAVTWLRRANEFVSRLALTDQSYVMRISLRHELEVDLLDVIKRGWSFTLSKLRFNGQCLVRLRGIAAYVVDDKGDAFYELDVNLPSDTATVLYPGDPNASQLDQTLAPVCRIRGAGGRSVTKSLSAIGTPSLHNCSPIGQWKVRMLDSSIRLATSKKLSDVQLDLYVAAQNAEG